jgi:Interferon-induced transmembrane protein
MSYDPPGNPPPGQYGDPGQGGQYQQYPASAAGQQYGAPGSYGPPPPTHRGWAITTTILGIFFGFIFIGMILGIIAIVQGSTVKSAWSAGDTARAERASRTARTLCIIATVIEAIVILLVIVLIATHGSTTTS